MSLHDELVATRSWHYHCISVYLIKQSSYHRNGRRDMQLLCLPNLAFMASLNESFHIINQHGPPKVQQQACSN